MEDFVAHRSSLKVISVMALSAGFAAAALWMTGFLATPFGSELFPLSIGKIIWWLIFLLFGYVAVAISPDLFGNAERLRISGAGIRLIRWSDQIIPWNQILDVSIWIRGHGRNQTHSIILHMRDGWNDSKLEKNDHVSRTIRMTRHQIQSLIKYSPKQSFIGYNGFVYQSTMLRPGDIEISPSNLNCGLQRIIQEIAKHKPRMF